MAGIRLLVLCSVVALASCQRGPGSPSFCLELLKSEDKQQTAQALLGCAGKVRQEVQRSGRQFKLSPTHYDRIGRCIAQRVGVIQSDGTVNKAQLRNRILSSTKINEQQRQFYMGLVPACETWDSCLKQHCKI